MNYYEILQVTDNASDEVIRMAYKALAKKYHPDIYDGDLQFAEEMMKQINEAYSVLSDKDKRAQYDESLRFKSRASENHTSNAYSDRASNTFQKFYRKFDSTSTAKSGWVIGIFLALIFIEVWHPYMESVLYDYSFWFGLKDFCLMSIFMMSAPLFIGTLTDIYLKEIKIVCLINSIAIYCINLLLYACDWVQGMFIGWIVALCYYFVNKHIIYQIRQKNCNTKKSIIILSISLLASFLIYIGIGYGLKNVIKPTLDTNNNSGAQEQTVEWISECDFFYYDDLNEYVLLFELADPDHIPISTNGMVKIKIVNNDNVIVYEESRGFTKNNFSKWSYSDGTQKFLACISISPLSVKEGTSSAGTVYFTVYGSSYSFTESSLTVSDLPVKPALVELPNLPISIDYRGYTNELYTTTRIDSITYEIKNDDDLYVYFSGEKLYDYKGTNATSYCEFRWKLYDSEGYLLKNDTVFISDLIVGDKFKNETAYAFDCIEPGESYKIVISEY